MEGEHEWGELAVKWMERTGSCIYIRGEKQGLPNILTSETLGKGSFTSFVLNSTRCGEGKLLTEELEKYCRADLWTLMVCTH